MFRALNCIGNTNHYKELLEAKIPDEVHSWAKVKAIAISLFVNVDMEHAAWNFLYNIEYHWGDNLEVHYSKLGGSYGRQNLPQATRQSSY